MSARHLVKDRPATYRRLEDMLYGIAETIRPPERLTVTQAAVRFVKIKEKNYSGPWNERKTPYVVEPQNMTMSLDYTGMVFVGPARTGKALALDTPIPVPTGWSTMGNLRVGDEVFDENGEVCRVIAVTNVMYGRSCYRVEFSDGEALVADAEHQWQVSDGHRPNTQHVMTTEQMLQTHRYGKTQRSRYWVAIAGALDLPEATLPLHPYVLGAWLGDGTSDAASLTCGADDASEMESLLTECGTPVRYGRENACGAKLLLLSDKRYGGFVGARSPVIQALLDLNLGYQGAPKHIPANYLRASREQRIALLQGLMDTDGHADVRGQLEFCTTSPQIADGFAELLSSLGYKFCLMKRPAAAKTAHRFIFFAAEGDRVFRLSRKQARVDATSDRRKVSNRRRYITAIVPVESVPVRCIQVSSTSSLYLAGRNMVPTHNSQMFLNWMSTTAMCDPADMMLLQMSRPRAREFSLSDLAKLFRNSADVREKLVPGRQNDNVYDKAFRSGMRVTIVHPSINELSGKTVGRLWAMDYDRIDDDIDGEGDAWTLLKKRAQTLGRHGMTVIESSPGRPVVDAKWMRRTPHEAPPCTGILARYNEGTRARWYWSCQQCDHKFEGDFHLLHFPDEGSPRERARQTTMPCPSCGFPHTPDMQSDLNMAGRWVHEGETWHDDGTVTGSRRESDIISYWLKGPAAAFTTWPELVEKFINATDEYDRTGSEESLKSVTNVDLGLPYASKTLESGRLPEDLKNRAEEWGTAAEEPTVPPGVRFLMAMVDVQGGGAACFVVHIFGIDEHGDIWHVDMFKIRKSARLDDQGERERLNPSSYVEDWELLVDQVMERSYPLSDASGRRMGIKLTACDSGGSDGATATAYEFYLRLRERGLAGRFHLLKGVPSKTETAPIRTAYPNAETKGNKFERYRSIPVQYINSNIVKDNTSNLLDRAIPGGMIHFPWWAPDWLYAQLTNEVRLPNGQWEKVGNRKNEAWDLLAYAVAFLSHRDINIRYIDWANPPSWAAEWDRNDFVFAEGQQAAFDAPDDPEELSFEELAKRLG